MTTSERRNSNEPSKEPPVVPIMLCNTCGAPLDGPPTRGRQSRCWMCGQNPSAPALLATNPQTANSSANPYAAAAPNVIDPQIAYPTALPIPPQPRNKAYDTIFSVLLIICLGLAIFVGIGLAVQDTGALVGYMILVLPAFCVTGVRSLWQYSKKGEANPKSMFLSLIVSFAVTICILFLLAVAGVVLLMFMCFSELAR